MLVAAGVVAVLVVALQGTRLRVSAT